MYGELGQPCSVQVNEIYLGFVSSTSLTPDEIRAAAETHHELGPDYQSAVIESFLDKVGKEIDARVDSRMAVAQPAPRARPYAPFALAVTSMALGIPLTAITLAVGSTGLSGLLVIWLAISVINVAYSLSSRPPSSRR
jgi:hypothetical protein